MKNAFLKVANWVKTHLPTKRRLIQIYAALLFNANLKGFVSGRIYTGKTKYACVPGMNCYSCPGAVGSCPLGSLQNALASSGKTAPYYVIGILALFGLILGRTICGYLCPVGLGQELLYKIHTPKLKKNKFTRVLSYLKYVLLVGFVIIIPILYGQQGIAVPGFCKYVCPAGTFGGGLGLLLNPNNQDYLAMLGPIFTWKFCLLMVIMAACVFCYRSFCRFLCPLGAIYGFFNRFAFIGVQVDKDNCTDCGLCVSHCKMDIRHVGDHECINCGECVDVCPTKAISWKGSRLFLRHNEVEGATDNPVNLLNEDASQKTDSSLSQAVAYSTSPKLGVTIDGYAGISPAAFNRMALDGAGIASPMLIPDAGIPTGGSANQNDVRPSASSQDGAKNDVSEDPSSEATSSAQDILSPKSDKTPAPSSKDDSDAGASGSKRKPADKLKSAVRKPKFWVQITAVTLALALLIGAFVYFNALQKDAAAVITANETYCGAYALDGDDISLTVTSLDDGEINSISLQRAAEGLELELQLSYEGAFDSVSVTYTALLTTSQPAATLDGLYSGEITLADSNMSSDEIAGNGVKCYAGESVRAILKDGRFALQLGNDGLLSEGMIIRDFTLNLYEMNSDGKYAYTQNTFNMFEHLGEVVVINFWGVWCGPCVEEIPDFEQFKRDYPEVTVLAIHGDPITQEADPWAYVSRFIDSKGWHSVSFAQDILSGKVCQTYNLLGGKDVWPITLIVDRFGKVAFLRQGKLSYEVLKTEATALL